MNVHVGFQWKGLGLVLGVILVASCVAPDVAEEPVTPEVILETEEAVSEDIVSDEVILETEDIVSDKITLAFGGLGNEMLDPKYSPGDNTHYLRLVFDSCMDLDRDALEISDKTGLCESWVISPEEDKITFKVREGVLFHDGVEVTADDFVFSLQRLWDDGTIAPNAKLIMDTVGPKENIRATGKYEFEIEVTKPPLTMMNHFPYGSSETLVVPKHYIEEVGEEEFRRNPIGTGPYKVVSQELGSHIAFEAVENHYGVGVPAFKEVEMLLVPEESTRVAMLKTGEADAVDVGVERAIELRDLGFNVHVKDMSDVQCVYFQLWEDTPPLNDIRVREALSLAISRDEIAESLFGGFAKTASNFRTSVNPGFVKHEPLPTDVERAKELMKEAGYEEGFDINLHGFAKPGWPQINTLEVIASDWAKIGVRSTILYRDFGSYRADWLGKNLPDPSATLHPIPAKTQYTGELSFLGHSQGAAAIHGDTRLDGMVEEYLSARTIDQFYELETEIDKYIVENYIMIPVVEYSLSLATNEKIPQWKTGATTHSLNLRYFLGGWQD